MRQSQRTLSVATAIIAAALLVNPPATAAGHGGEGGDTPTPPDWLELDDGVSAPQFDLADAVEQTVFVQTQVDSDLDGENDRVRLKLSRPAATESEGIKVPVVFEHSPYRYDIGATKNHPVNYERLPQSDLRPNGPPKGRARTAAAHAPGPNAEPGLPGSLDDYWVPRGYAVVLGESIGTGFSDGCPTVGSMKETLATKAIIDWLNGRAKAFTPDGEPVVADWTKGNVGMVGVSYNGTLANMVATTGVDGLRTIVPTSAIASWYDYYRANGLVRAPHSAVSGAGKNYYQGEDTDVLAEFTQGAKRAEQCADVTEQLREKQDRATGDFNEFWYERDYLHRADGIDASVFVVHGREDYNVMGTAYASWWHQLRRYDVPRKIWLHNGGHGGTADRAKFQPVLHRWMDHWLFGVDNGIMTEPAATVQRPDGSYDYYAGWPKPGARATRLYFGSANATDPGVLSSHPQQGTEQSFVDRGRELATDTKLVPNPDQPDPNRLVYVSPELEHDVHFSGTPSMSLRAAVNNRYAANLTAVVVDYGPKGSEVEPVMVTRGWMDVQNRHSAWRSEPVRQGKFYTFRWDLEPEDYIFPAGHRIGVVIVSTDKRFTLRPAPGTELSVQPGKSRIALPIVGGKHSLEF